MQEYLVPLERATEVKETFQKAISDFSRRHLCLLADGRILVSNGIAAEALNGNAKDATKDYGADIGVRIYFGNVPAMGFAGRILGKKDFDNISEITDVLLKQALKRAKANSSEKEKVMRRYKDRAKGLYKTEFAKIPAPQKVLTKPYKKNPIDADVEDFITQAENISKDIGKISGIATNAISIFSMLERKVFASSEGSMIEQTRAITEPSIFVAANGTSKETYHEWISEPRGLEALDGQNSHGKTFEEFCHFIANGTVELSNAPAVKNTQNAAIVTDPWFNTLLSHEICGHPLEADRALKRETAWAGRAWWFKNLEENEFGKQVGSEEMTIVSNPGADGYGNFAFDDEGTPGKKTTCIENGFLREFMNSRETSIILGENANGHMRASSASNAPLIRMSNTYFEKGSWKAQELIEDTRDGFYISGQKTPSIGESRQNFNITCWKIFEIKNGEIGKLYRNGGIEGNSAEMFKTIEAADDVKLFNVPNCGKGTPMQTMRVGNGGPHLRILANITGKRD